MIVSQEATMIGSCFVTKMLSDYDTHQDLVNRSKAEFLVLIALKPRPVSLMVVQIHDQRKDLCINFLRYARLPDCSSLSASTRFNKPSSICRDAFSRKEDVVPSLLVITRRIMSK